jgi:hypothetical protein
MGELKEKARAGEVSVTRGKLKTVFKRVTGVRKIDREVARNNMKAAGYTQINKNKSGRSLFAANWRRFVY